MTSRLSDYEICYVLNGEARQFIQCDTQMNDADAWYYATLHSGVGLHYGSGDKADKAAVLRRHAQRRGLADVKWRLIK